MNEQDIAKLIENKARQYSQDISHVKELATRHNVELHRWCVRRRRHESVRRVFAAVCLVVLFAFGADMVFAKPPQYTEKAIAGNTDVKQTVNTIYTILNLL